MPPWEAPTGFASSLFLLCICVLFCLLPPKVDAVTSEDIISQLIAQDEGLWACLNTLLQDELAWAPTPAPQKKRSVHRRVGKRSLIKEEFMSRLFPRQSTSSGSFLSASALFGADVTLYNRVIGKIGSLSTPVLSNLNNVQQQSLSYFSQFTNTFSDPLPFNLASYFNQTFPGVSSLPTANVVTPLVQSLVDYGTQNGLQLTKLFITVNASQVLTDSPTVLSDPLNYAYEVGFGSSSLCSSITEQVTNGNVITPDNVQAIIAQVNNLILAEIPDPPPTDAPTNAPTDAPTDAPSQP